MAAIHAQAPAIKIAILTGLPQALDDRPEREWISAVLEKPCPTRRLLSTVAKLLACFVLAAILAAGKDFQFRAGANETIAELELESPGSDFAIASRAAAVARVRVNGGAPQHIIVLGERKGPYTVFLGSISPGEHTLSVERDNEFSAPESRLEIGSAKFRDDSSELVAHAPILFARADTVGKFSDIPLLVYVENNPLQYTVIFSHEDGGTSTRGLMSRWGRTTDIEHVYRRDGNAWLIQTRDHKDVPYNGPREGQHPLLIPVTQNNMVEHGTGVMRFQMVPQPVDLTSSSREIAMDQAPWTYAIAAKELQRQDRLKEIGDPRDYLYLEAKIWSQNGRIGFRARLTTETFWRTSYQDDPQLAIERSGWVRSTIRMPPGTSLSHIAEIGIDCMPEPKQTQGTPATPPPKPQCRLEDVSDGFFLTPQYIPGRPLRLPWQR